MVRLAIVGCAHGELDAIYQCLDEMKSAGGGEVDAVLCCGDFQSVRDRADLETMSCPPKYRKMHDFWKYYTGAKTAPVLTIFIGGNHEASNFLQELPMGGFVAPNIFYMGYASVIRWSGLVILGMSGIYKHHDYNTVHWEVAPYRSPPYSIKSIYHIRKQEVDRVLKWAREQPRPFVDIALSHDWPRGVEHHGNLAGLLRHKPFLSEDVNRRQLGSPPLWDVLAAAKPKYWFSAHLHTKFTAEIRDDPEHVTQFLALDKILPGRSFLQVVCVSDEEVTDKTVYPEEKWLETLRLFSDSSTPLQISESPFKNPSSHQEIESTATQTNRILSTLGLTTLDSLFPRNTEKKPMPAPTPNPNVDEIDLDL